MNGLGRGDQKEKQDKNSLFTRETVGMTLLLFSALALLISITRELMFGEVGIAITAFLLGCFGYLTYPLLALIVCISAQMVSGKNFLSRKWTGWFWAILIVSFFIVHLATSAQYLGVSYGEYLGSCFMAAEGGIVTCTGGGLIFGLVVYPLQSILSTAGAYVIFGFGVAILLFFLLRATPVWGRVSGMRREERRAAPAQPKAPNGSRAYPGTFDDLPAPTHTPMPAREVASLYPEPTMPAPPARAQQPAPLSGRDILFSSTPESSYRENLIFDRDSRFNTQPRSSNLTEISPLRPTPPNPSAPSYSERYFAETEQSRPAMPRRVETQEGANFAGADVNYRQPTPSYRAPQAPQEPVREDYYKNDVAPQEMAIPQSREEDYYKKDVAPQSAQATPERGEDFYKNDVLPDDDYDFEEGLADEAEGSYSSAPNVRDYTPPVAPTAPETRGEDRSSFRGLFSSSNDRLSERTETGRELFPRAEGVRDPYSDRGASLPEATGNREISEPEGVRDPYSERSSRGEDLYPRGEDRSRAIEGLERTNPADVFDDEEIEDVEPIAPMLPSFVTPDRPPRESTVRPVMQAVTPIPDEPAPVPQKRVIKPYRRPSLDHFMKYSDVVSVSSEEIERNSTIIVETLASFRVEAKVERVTCGSAVTRYDIDIPTNVSVSTVIKRGEEIAMRLHARNGVNIYSNRELGAISIEVPNINRATVGVRSVMETEEYVNAKPNSLTFVIGKDVEGRPVCGNIVKMKHVLVAGATGSGKSVCLNAMLISLICKYSPEELRLILIDPKKIEFGIYDGLPHLMINEIISDAQKAVTALNWAVKEMERRYELFQQKAKSGIRISNLDAYNEKTTEDEEKLPKIVIVIDELADLMMVSKKDVEERIQRLTQKARAAGIHLVLATQRPSVDVITGVIKGNLPTRMAFAVVQEVDSRTILDETGAEKLLGAGDLLYRSEGMFNCRRVQGAFLSDDEVGDIVQDIKTHNESYYDEKISDYINKVGSGNEGGGGGEEGDGGQVNPQYIRALAMVVKSKSASISLIQRKCSVGYNHAGKIVEWMELMGYISAFDGSKARTVLLTKEEFEAKYGNIDDA